MSYDVTLTIDTGGESPHIVHQQNLFGPALAMIRQTLPGGTGLNSLHGKQAGDAAKTLLNAADHMDASQRTYLTAGDHRPGVEAWQVYQDARAWLRELGEVCQGNPLCDIDVSH